MIKKLACGAEVFIDDSIANTIPEKGWHINSHGYAVRQIRVGGKKKTIYMHHLILPAKKGYDIDHINMNKLDNRRKNLRYVTRSQNILNMAPKSNNKSGHTGVSFDRARGKWRAYIGGSKTRIELGYYSDKKLAINARNKAKQKMFDSIYGLKIMKLTRKELRQ